MLYDVFICHASEDKQKLVRPLAKALAKENIVVWYDEFELKPGDSLRESIDRGLAKSRHGIVVLSEAFFKKRWTQRELNGLVARQMAGEEKVIIPIWHQVTVEDIIKFSPPMADIFSIPANKGIKYICRELLRIIRPQESPLIIARDELLAFGVTPPVISDEWWLDVIEASNRISNAGAYVPESSTWGRWTFPLPNEESHGEARGVRLAWVAMQLKWEKEAEKRNISQITHPELVLKFIDEMPGLYEACMNFPDWLAAYAPQLTIPGFGGDFESIFSKMALDKEFAPEMIFRTNEIDKINAGNAACHFVQGELLGPSCRFYEIFDYLIWILSSDSNWLPPKFQKLLRHGMAEWTMWVSNNKTQNDDFLEWLFDLDPNTAAPRMPRKIVDTLSSMIEDSLIRLNLKDDVKSILKRFNQYKCIKHYLDDRSEMRRRNQSRLS